MLGGCGAGKVITTVVRRSIPRRRDQFFGRIASTWACAPASVSGASTTERMTPSGPTKNWRRQAPQPVVPEDLAGQVGADLVVELVALGVRPDVVRARLLDADPDDLQAAVAVAVGDVAEDRRLRLARRAPRGEEVDPDGLALQVARG